MTEAHDTATYLQARRDSQEPMRTIPAALYPDTLATAFAVQNELVRMLAEQYDSVPCGHKIACTHELVAQRLHAQGPFPGRLMTHSNYESGAQLDPTAFRLRLTEAEFGFILGEDVPKTSTSYTAQTIRPFIEAFVPCLEVVDHGFHDFTTVGERALIADNAIHGACIFGEPITAWQSIDFVDWPVHMHVNGNRFTTGTGKNALGNPLHAMAWLANHLSSRGLSLCAGEVVATGTVGEVYSAQAGDIIVADYGSLGEVRVQFNHPT